jgi:alpha-1,3-glucosyltransferase
MESEVRPGRTLEEVLKSVTITTPQQEAAQEIDSTLPEALRARVLEWVQFMTIPRMDDLGKFQQFGICGLSLTCIRSQSGF